MVTYANTGQMTDSSYLSPTRYRMTPMGTYSPLKTYQGQEKEDPLEDLYARMNELNDLTKKMYAPKKAAKTLPSRYLS